MPRLSGYGLLFYLGVFYVFLTPCGENRSSASEEELEAKRSLCKRHKSPAHAHSTLALLNTQQINIITVCGHLHKHHYNHQYGEQAPETCQQ